MNRLPRRSQRGFTLVELLIVVMTLAILAAIVVPSFGDVPKETKQTAFINDLAVIVTACQLYHAKNGYYPDDASSGELPPGMDSWVRPNTWTRATPVGGVWDTEVSAVGVHYTGDNGPDLGDAYFTEIDAFFDDGSLATGAFQKIEAGRYYFVFTL